MDFITFFQVVANSLLARKCFLKTPTLIAWSAICGQVQQIQNNGSAPTRSVVDILADTSPMVDKLNMESVL